MCCFTSIFSKILKLNFIKNCDLNLKCIASSFVFLKKLQTIDDNTGIGNLLIPYDIDTTNDQANDEAIREIIIKANLGQPGQEVDNSDLYPQYCARFLVLIGFCFGTAMNGCVWISLVAITDEVRDAYKVSEFYLNMWSFVFMIMYLPCNFLANYTHETLGVRYGILVATIFTAIGAWFKIFVNLNFKFYIMLGNIFAAFAQPFFLNASAFLANTWFNEKWRTIATTIAGMSNSIGTATGMIFPTFFVKPPIDGDDDIAKYNRQGIRQNLIFQACFATLIALFWIIFVQNKPPIPPSASASAKREPFWASFKKLWGDKQFLKLMVCYALMNAVFGNIATLIGVITEKYGFGAKERGYFGMSYLIGGIIGMYFFGYILSKTKAYKILSGLTPLLTIGTIILFYCSLEYTHDDAMVLIISSAIVGSTILPSIPIWYEFAAEITFPVGEASSSGTMMLWGQFFSFTFGLICSTVIQRCQDNGHEKLGGFISLWILAVASFISCVFAYLIQPDFKRQNRENKPPTPKTIRKLSGDRLSERLSDA